MAIPTKPSEDVLAQKQKQLNAIRTGIARLKAVAPLAETKEWKAVQGLIRQQIQDVNAALDEHHKLTADEKTILLERRKNMKFFFELPNDSADTVNKLITLEKNLVKEIADYRARLHG